MSMYMYHITLSFFLSFFFILNVNAKDYQVSPKQIMLSDDELSLFMPVNFTGQGINKFLKNIYNRPAYAQELLPNNFSHLVQFLEFGNKTKQADQYIKSVFRLFGKKLKAVPYVNAYAYVYLLEKLPHLLDRYVNVRVVDDTQTKETVSSLIYQAFVSQFSLCKTDPTSFLHGLSDQIVTVVSQESPTCKAEVSKEQIRQLIIRFLETGIGKLVWSPAEHKEIWDSVKSISSALAHLHERRVISQADDLDDLYWSLVNRFCYFIELSGEDLPPQFYVAVKKDVSEHAASFLMLEEQEAAIQTKAQTVVQALMHGEARSRAREHGVVVRG